MRSVAGMSREVVELIVPRGGGRIDRLICDETGFGRRIVKRWLREGRVRVAGHLVTGSEIVAAGDRVEIERPDPDAGSHPGEPPRVLVENEQLVVVAKPAGMHSERGRSPGSVAEFLERRYGDLSDVGERASEAGLVHRLDRDTSGVLVAARTPAGYRRLRRAFSLGHVHKEYIALAHGRVAAPLVVDEPLAQRGDHVVVARRGDDGLPARTVIAPLEGGPDWSLVHAAMSTGVMHQVRAHLAAAGHPLVGDPLYGGRGDGPAARCGQWLHALRIRIDGEIDVTVGPPEDFVRAYAALRRRSD